MLVVGLALSVSLPLPAMTEDDSLEVLADLELLSIVGSWGGPAADCAGVVIGTALGLLLLGAATGGAGWVVAGAYVPVLITAC